MNNTVKTPPMGWNSWDCYGAGVTEDIVRANAEYMAKNLKPFGWEYIVVDIQWYEPNAATHEYSPFTELCTDGTSRLVPAVNRFPSAADGKGFAPLAEYVHSLGLKFGIHIMRGIPRQAVHNNEPLYGSNYTARQVAKTHSICYWNTDMYGVDPEKPGAKDYYDSIFKLYADWGVDFVKCDDIARELPQEETELVLLSESLHRCGRDMVLSLSPGPALLEKAELYKQTADMWRITDDFWDKWELLYNMFERCEKWAPHVGAGHWPDADMLPVGAIRQDYGADNVTNFTMDEQRTMMTLWSIFRSPLIIGGEMTKFDPDTLALLTNADIIAMNKNSRLAHQVWRRKTADGELCLWAAACSEGGHYAALFNLGDTEAEMTVPLADLELYSPMPCKELWSGKESPAVTALSATLPAHGSAAFLLR